MSKQPKQLKIISGGQTGADRAALDFAMEHGFPHGGWCPKGRRAEDGPIDERYQLTETPTARYLERTKFNVRESDGTVVFTLSKEPGRGSKKTLDFARKLKKPVLHLAKEQVGDHGKVLRSFLTGHQIKTLNVAGSRGTGEAGIEEFVRETLERALLTLPAVGK